MILKINLQLFGETAGGEKTEKATPKRKRDARKKGQVLQSKEISSALTLLFVFFGLRVLGSYMVDTILKYSEKVYLLLESDMDFYNIPGMINFATELILNIVIVIAPIMAIAAISGMIISYAQVGSLFTVETLQFKFDKISPLGGFKRIFSSKTIAELAKSLLKIFIILGTAYLFINGQTERILNTMNQSIVEISSFMAITAINLAITIALVLLVLGILDYIYQTYDYEKSLKMTKKEIKEEYKQTEGNPEIKSAIKQKQRQISMRRMLQEVPEADVVITNPTHYSVAVKYDADISDAPLVIAKGVDFMAQRIKDVARENNVEIVENKELARVIYDTVNIGDPIPSEMYQAVAEILAYVYSLRE
jgi:flagellar biosynthetic protein FlhB